ncbi:MAG: VOC family protein [Pseudomonadota bacterium]
MADAIGFDGGLTLSIPVSDLNRSVAWYQEVLGLQLIYQMDELGWCELASPVARVNVGLSQVEVVKRGETTPTWGVSDIEKAQAALLEKGVKLDGEVQVIDGMVKLLGLFDLDDNAIMLYQDISEN